MGKKIYVGNLAYWVNSSDLQRMFEEFGTVQSAQVILGRNTGRSKGFGFVEMGSDAEAQAAIDALTGKNVDGRNLKVNEAHRGAGGRGGYGGGGGRGSYGGGRGGYGGGRRDRYLRAEPWRPCPLLTGPGRFVYVWRWMASSNSSG
jgi:hypothetical protein